MQRISSRHASGPLRGAVIALAGFACALAAPAMAGAAASCVPNAGSTHMVCTYTTVGADTFTVPAGVAYITVVATGGNGGEGGHAGARGGKGAVVTTTDLAVGGLASPIALFVGGGGGGGLYEWSATGGGSTTFAVGTTLRIIAGGGGGGGASGTGGRGGDAGMSNGSGGAGQGGNNGAGGGGGIGGAGGGGGTAGGNGNGGPGGLAGGTPNVCGTHGTGGPGSGTGSGGNGECGGPNARTYGGGGGGGGYGGGGGGGMTCLSLCSVGGGGGAGGSTGPNGSTFASASTDSGANGSLVVTYPTQTQTIGFTSSGAATTVGATRTAVATATSNLPVTYSTTSASVCTVSASGAITFDHAGTCIVNADQGGSGDYLIAPRAQQSITVDQAAQSIIFTSTPPSAAMVDGATYTPTATGGASGNAVTFAIDPATQGTCTLTAGIVAFIGAGTCTINASQAGNDDYLAAASTQSFSVGRAAQSIIFTSTPPSAAMVDGATYTPTATGGASGNAVTFAIDPATRGICTLTAGVVAFIGVGTCTINASQAGNDDYLAAPGVEQSFSVTATVRSIAAAPTAAGSTTVAGATISWPIGAFATPVTIVVTTASSSTVAFADGRQPISLTVVDAAGNRVTSFEKPLELVFAAGTIGTPGYSRDGRTWTAIPRITGTTLPAGYRDGWYRAADGTTHVLTLHATDFGVVKKGQKLRPALVATVRAPRAVNVHASTGFGIVVSTSLPATTVITLRTPSGRRVKVRQVQTSRMTTVAIRLPAGARSAGRYTLIVDARAGDAAAVVRTPIRLIAALPEPVTG